MEHIGKQNQTFVRQEKTIEEAKAFLENGGMGTGAGMGSDTSGVPTI